MSAAIGGTPPEKPHALPRRGQGMDASLIIPPLILGVVVALAVLSAAIEASRIPNSALRRLLTQLRP